MKTVLGSDAVAVAHGVAEDVARPALTCVKIGDGEIIAADGFMVVRHPLKIEGEGTALVEGKTILRVQEAMPYDELSVELKGEELVIQSPHSDFEVHASNRAIISKEYVFPTHINELYPSSEPKAFIALGTSLLRRLLDAVGDAPILKLRIREANEPVEFIAGDTTGLAMPYFTPQDDERWHKTGSKKDGKKKSGRQRK